MAGGFQTTTSFVGNVPGGIKPLAGTMTQDAGGVISTGDGFGGM
ncbi:hypothetical protein N8652_01485 [bacterium]|nr:hypothetical protein [bacterium]